MVTPARPYMTVEVKPERAHVRAASTASSIASSSTPPASPGKQVRFVVAPTKSTKPQLSTPPPSPGKSVRFARNITTEPRELNHTEKSSLWNYEQHAQYCAICKNVGNAVYGDRFCSTGYALALDTSLCVRLVEGVACARHKEHDKYARLRIPEGYLHVPAMLQAAREQRHAARRQARAAADRPAPPVVGQQRSPDGFLDTSFTTASPYVSQSTSPIYATSLPHRQAPVQRRHSAYEPVYATPLQTYRVEIREPERKEHRRKKDSRRSSVYYV